MLEKQWWNASPEEIEKVKELEFRVGEYVGGVRNEQLFYYMISDKIEKQRQLYLEFVYANNRSLKQVNPTVSKVEIEYTIHWFDLPSGKKSHQFALSADSSVIVLADYPNNRCMSNGFSLTGVLESMLVQNQIEENNTIKCDRCPAKLDYSIKIEYEHTNQV